MHVCWKWQENQTAIRRGALDQTLMVNRLIDMDWKFGGEFNIEIFSLEIMYSF